MGSFTQNVATMNTIYTLYMVNFHKLFYISTKHLMGVSKNDIASLASRDQNILKHKDGRTN